MEIRMGAKSIKIDEKKKKKLKTIASLKGETMSSIVEKLIDDYVTRFYQEDDQAKQLKAMMKVSEPSFNEWDNDEDRVYDDL
jgi:predicted transcriptional regulator